MGASGMMEALFDLDVSWLPLYKPFDLTLSSVLMAERCRDCGRTGGNTGHYCQGSRPAGIFMLCDDCAALEGRWGIQVTDRDALVAGQQQRRARYLRTIHTNGSQA